MNCEKNFRKRKWFFEVAEYFLKCDYDARINIDSISSILLVVDILLDYHLKSAFQLW